MLSQDKNLISFQDIENTSFPIRFRCKMQKNRVMKEEEFSAEYIDMKAVAKICKFKVDGKLVGRNKLFQLLRKKKILQEGNNLPYKKYIEAGYFEIKRSTVERALMNPKQSAKTLISLSGIEFIKEQLNLN